MNTVKREYSSVQKTILILLVILIHSSVWAYVNYFNSQRPLSHLHDLSIFLDRLIPYLGWSWFVYYFGHIYIVVGSSFAIWNFKRNDFLKIIFLFSLMIVVGGIIQLIIPAKSPMPEQMGYIHHWIHQNISHDPYVCFPSMHVALATIPSLLFFEKYKSALNRFILVMILLLIFMSTVTLKEHYFIDSVAGLFMAFFFYILFRLKNFLKNKMDFSYD